MAISTHPVLKVILAPVIWLTKFLGRNYPEFLVNVRYFVRFRRILNLSNPKTLNEKILYMSLRTDTTLWTRLADKYSVRGFIEELGLSDILVPLYSHWDNVCDIDFDKLPQRFVLKTTHGSGDIIIVKEKSSLDIRLISRQLQKSVETKFGELEGGRHYLRIKPAIVAEALLENDELSKKYSSSIIDYKIWCFNGKPHYIWTCCNRNDISTDVMTYDLNWNAHPEYSIFNKHYKQGVIMPKPQNLNYMLEVAEKLAKAFPVVRVDLYNIGGKIYFGEMTFTSLGGLMDFYTEEFQNIAGDLIDVNYNG